MSTIDMSFRPDSYWPESLTPEQFLSRIRGRVRQDIARKTYEREGFRGLSQFLVKEGLDDEERSAWGSVGPWCLGGEFLPPLHAGEVEIARVSLASVTSDQISVRARREDGPITYRVVGEYEEEESMRYVLPFAQSEHPLTLAELIDLIEGAVIPGCAYPGGIFTSHWLMMNDYYYDAKEIIAFLSLSSPFYTQLAACYQALCEQWVAENREFEHEEE